jgi:hypothetical protein
MNRNCVLVLRTFAFFIAALVAFQAFAQLTDHAEKRHSAKPVVAPSNPMHPRLEGVADLKVQLVKASCGLTLNEFEFTVSRASESLLEHRINSAPLLLAAEDVILGATTNASLPRFPPQMGENFTPFDSNIESEIARGNRAAQITPGLAKAAMMFPYRYECRNTRALSPRAALRDLLQRNTQPVRSLLQARGGLDTTANQCSYCYQEYDLLMRALQQETKNAVYAALTGGTVAVVAAPTPLTVAASTVAVVVTATSMIESERIKAEQAALQRNACTVNCTPKVDAQVQSNENTFRSIVNSKIESEKAQIDKESKLRSAPIKGDHKVNEFGPSRKDEAPQEPQAQETAGASWCEFAGSSPQSCPVCDLIAGGSASRDSQLLQATKEAVSRYVRLAVAMGDDPATRTSSAPTSPPPAVSRNRISELKGNMQARQFDFLSRAQIRQDVDPKEVSARISGMGRGRFARELSWLESDNERCRVR